MNLTIHDHAELASMTLTFPTIALCSVVVFLYSRHAVESYQNDTSREKSTFWLIVGIAIGFAGEVLDNVYWAIPWSLSFIGHPETDAYMQWGVYFNIPFRQIAAIIASMCHVYAAALSRGVSKWLGVYMFFAALLAGILYSVLLVVLRG